jgi:hypothetical protein
VKLVNIGNRGNREYESADKRFHVKWWRNQGSRSCYIVTDHLNKTTTGLRAFTLEEARETIRGMIANDRLRVALDGPLPAAHVDGNSLARDLARVRIPNEGEKVVRHTGTSTVYLAVREVRHRMMGSREEGRFEAELRNLTADFYATVGRVARPTRAAAIEAAHALAKKRGWTVSDKRIGWAARDAAYERAIAEDAAGYVKDAKRPRGEAAAEDPLCACGHRRSDHGGDYLHCRVCPHSSGAATASYQCPMFVRAMTAPMLFTEFVTEMTEILREARETQRQCPATPMTDARGRNIALYYGDWMERLEDAVDLVNERVSTRGKT